MRLDRWVQFLLCAFGLGCASPVQAAIRSYRDEDGNWVIIGRPDPSQVRRSAKIQADGWYPPKALPYRSEIDKYARQWNLPTSLVIAVIEVESDFNPRVVSRKGAKGLMQLMDETARDMGVRDVFDPAENIRGGCKYLSYLIHRFEGKTEHVLAGYNAGPTAVERYKGIPPYRETIHYVRNVKAKHEDYRKRLTDSNSSPPVPLEKRRAKPPLRAFVDEFGVIHLTSGR